MSAWSSAPYPVVYRRRTGDPLLSSVRAGFKAAYDARFGASSGGGFYHAADWWRLDFAAGKILPDTRSVLDVGVGPGAFLNYLSMRDREVSVVGIDRVDYSKYVALTEGLDRRIMDAARMTFEDKTFDVVFCMEVLEHVEPAILPNVLAQLRRVARRRLVVTVPFEEPEPLPLYHKQRFDAAAIEALFPAGKVELLDKTSWLRSWFAPSAWRWAMVTEDLA